MDFKKDMQRKEKTDSPGSSQKKNETGIQRSKQTEIEKKTSNNTVKSTQKSVAKGASERAQKSVTKSTPAGVQKGVAKNTLAGAQKSVTKSTLAGAQKSVTKSTLAGAQKDATKSTSAGAQKDATKSTSAGAQKNASKDIRKGVMKSVQKKTSGSTQKSVTKNAQKATLTSTTESERRGKEKGFALSGRENISKKSGGKNKRDWKKTAIFIAAGFCILLLLLAGILYFRGCGGQKLEDATQSTVTVAKNGEVSQLLIEAFPTSQYSDSDLKDTVTQWITEYRQQHDKNAVVLESLEVEEEIAKLRIRYSSAEDYKGFNNVDFFTGTVEEAIAAGYEFPNIFINKDQEEISFTTIRSSCLQEKVIIIQEPLNVLAPNTILYASSNMEILDDQNAKLESDTMITYENGQTVTENYGFVIYNSK